MSKNEVRIPQSLNISCKDQPGILGEVGSFTKDQGISVANGQKQLIDDGNHLYLHLPMSRVDGQLIDESDFLAAFEPIRERFNMTLQPQFSQENRRIILLVTKVMHCAEALMSAARMGHLPVEVTHVVSNLEKHEEQKETVESYGVEFKYMPFLSTKDERVPEHDDALCDFFDDDDIEYDMIALARWMRIIDEPMLERIRGNDVWRIGNVHHGHLPDFTQGNVYRRAWQRQTKEVQANFHYVTPEVDEGPIVAQATRTVPEPRKYKDYVSTGRQNEVEVFLRGIDQHVNNQVMLTVEPPENGDAKFPRKQGTIIFSQGT